MECDTLEAAETYFVNNAITDLLLESLKTFPDIKLCEAMPPITTGFVAMESPILLTFDDDGQRLLINAFSWFMGGRRWPSPQVSEDGFFFSFYGHRGHQIYMGYLNRLSQRQRVFCLHWV